MSEQFNVVPSNRVSGIGRIGNSSGGVFEEKVAVSVEWGVDVEIDQLVWRGCVEAELQVDGVEEGVDAVEERVVSGRRINI